MNSSRQDLITAAFLRLSMLRSGADNNMISLLALLDHLIPLTILYVAKNSNTCVTCQIPLLSLFRGSILGAFLYSN